MYTTPLFRPHLQTSESWLSNLIEQDGVVSVIESREMFVSDLYSQITITAAEDPFDGTAVESRDQFCTLDGHRMLWGNCHRRPPSTKMHIFISMFSRSFAGVHHSGAYFHFIHDRSANRNFCGKRDDAAVLIEIIYDMLQWSWWKLIYSHLPDPITRPPPHFPQRQLSSFRYLCSPEIVVNTPRLLKVNGMPQTV